MICHKCHIDKSDEAFSKNQKACKSCCQEYMKEYRKTKNYKISKAKSDKKYAIAHKEQIKQYRSTDAFKKRANELSRENPNTAVAHRRYKEAHQMQYREYDKRWKLEHPEKVKIWSELWKEKNIHRIREIKHNYKVKRRLVESKGALSINIVGKLIDTQNNKCFYCDSKLETYHIDHIIPLAKGGEHKDFNVVLSCPKCNLTKSSKDPIQFVEEIIRRKG